MSKDFDDLVPPDRGVVEGRFNVCELCGERGSFWREIVDTVPTLARPKINNVQKYSLNEESKMSMMICPNGHFFQPGKGKEYGLLERLEREFYNSFKE